MLVFISFLLLCFVSNFVLLASRCQVRSGEVWINRIFQMVSRELDDREAALPHIEKQVLLLRLLLLLVPLFPLCRSFLRSATNPTSIWAISRPAISQAGTFLHLSISSV
jgi:hypothetical protein